MAFATMFCVTALSARASGQAACAGIEVVGSAELSASWATATDDLRKQMPIAAPGACAAMTLTVQPDAEGEARLVATSKDGRRAERLVDKPSSLGAMALGLVASLPPDEQTSASADSRPIQNAPASSAREISKPPPPPQSKSQPPPAATAASSDSPQVWLGGGLGARAAEPSATGMLDLEAHGDLEVRRWFLSVSLRYGSSIGETLAANDATYEETVIGIGVGRTFRIGKTVLQLLLEPSIAAVTIDDDDDTNGSYGSRSEVRVGAGVRWSIPLDNLWRFTITADSDLSPRSLTHYVYVDPSLPPLPLWTGALRLGVAGKLL
jgi:hypothetical protein